MANICVKIMVGKNPNDNFDCGREYTFSVGREDEKMPSDTMLNIIEKSMFKKIEDTFGVIIEAK